MPGDLPKAGSGASTGVITSRVTEEADALGMSAGARSRLDICSQVDSDDDDGDEEAQGGSSQ